MVNGKRHEWSSEWKDGRTESGRKNKRTNTKKQAKGLPAHRLINKRITKQTNKQSRHTQPTGKQTNNSKNLS